MDRDTLINAERLLSNLVMLSRKIENSNRGREALIARAEKTRDAVYETANKKTRKKDAKNHKALLNALNNDYEMELVGLVGLSRKVRDALREEINE